MATNRAQEGTSAVGKEKRVLSSSNSHSKKSSTVEKGPSGSEKQVPNYLKPTISSRLETHHRSFQLRSENTSKPDLDRRRSFDRPPSLKQVSLSSSRLQKALISPGPRERTVTRRASSSSSSLSVKSSTTASAKPISKTSRDGKLQQSAVSTSKPTVKKSSTSSSSSSARTKNKQQLASSANSSTKARKSKTAETLEKTSNVEKIDHQQEIKEAPPSLDRVVEEVEETPATLANGEPNDNDDDDPQIEADNDKVIPTDSEEVKTDPGTVDQEEQEVVVEATEKAEEEKPPENDIEHQVTENINQEEVEEKSDEVISHPQEISATEGELFEVKEKEDEEEKKEEKQNEIPVDENSHDVKEELEEKEVTEEGDGRASCEEVDLKEKFIKGEENGQDQVLEGGTAEEGSKNDETTKTTESTTPNKQVATSESGKGKESPQAYNDVIEETKNKLLGTRKNKVSALVGAFETVIDCESSSK